VDELQQRIIEECERLDQRVIDNAVKHWRRRLRSKCVAASVYSIGIYRGIYAQKSYISHPKVSTLCKTISLRLLVTGL